MIEGRINYQILALKKAEKMQRLEITNFIELMVVRFVHPRICPKKKKTTNIRHMSLEVKQKLHFWRFLPS